MTVSELIEKLKDLPEDAEVWHYQIYSDSFLEVHDATLQEDGVVEIS